MFKLIKNDNLTKGVTVLFILAFFGVLWWQLFGIWKVEKGQIRGFESEMHKTSPRAKSLANIHRRTNQFRQNLNHSTANHVFVIAHTGGRIAINGAYRDLWKELSLEENIGKPVSAKWHSTNFGLVYLSMNGEVFVNESQWQFVNWKSVFLYNFIILAIYAVFVRFRFYQTQKRRVD